MTDSFQQLLCWLVIRARGDESATEAVGGEDGSIQRGPGLTLFSIRNPELKQPQYRNWSLGIKQRLPKDITLSVDGLRKRGNQGLTYLNTLTVSDPSIDVIYDLFNSRRDVYDSIELAARQSIRGEYEWMASYTRSRALSNAVLNIGVDTTTQIDQNVGPMPWDAPNRFLIRGAGARAQAQRQGITTTLLAVRVLAVRAELSALTANSLTANSLAARANSYFAPTARTAVSLAQR